MTQEEVVSKLKELKPKYEKEGFVLMGLFGSYARNEANDKSDIDICYDINKKFLQLHSGWNSISRLEELKEELKNIFHTNIDLATVDTNNLILQEIFKKEMIHV